MGPRKVAMNSGRHGLRSDLRLRKLLVSARDAPFQELATPAVSRKDVMTNLFTSVEQCDILTVSRYFSSEDVTLPPARGCLRPTSKASCSGDCRWIFKQQLVDWLVLEQ